MSSLRCGARHRCRRGPPPAASRFTPSRFKAEIVPVALSKTTVKPSPATVIGLVVLREADRFRGGGNGGRRGNRQLELLGGDFISRLAQS